VLLLLLRLDLALRFVAVRHVLHQRRRRGLIDFVVRVIERGVQTDKHAGQFLHLGVRGGVLERRGRADDFLLQRDTPGHHVGGDGQKIVRGLLHGGDRQIRRFAASDRRAIRRVERRADAAEQPVGVVEHGFARVHRAFECGQRLAKLRFAQVGDERLDRREENRLGITKQAFVMFELAELIFERLNLLNLILNHLDVFGDFLRRVDDRLNSVGWVVNDPLCACRGGDAERHERECDESFHCVPFVVVCWTAATRRQSREKVYHHEPQRGCMCCARCGEVRSLAEVWQLSQPADGRSCPRINFLRSQDLATICPADSHVGARRQRQSNSTRKGGFGFSLKARSG